MAAWQKKNWAEVRREEEEDLTSARGFYNPHKADKISMITISFLDPPNTEVKQPLTIINIPVRRIIATKKCELNEIFL
jgi:hypothetical protein